MTSVTGAVGPLRLLLVDDEAPARRRMGELLSDIAAELPTQVVGEAANGEEALARQQAEPAQVALVDIRMPGMDGLELAQHLAGLPQPPVVIFVTAFDDYAVQAFELNAVDYLRPGACRPWPPRPWAGCARGPGGGSASAATCPATSGVACSWCPWWRCSTSRRT